MQFLRGSITGGAAAMAGGLLELVRHFSRKRSVDVRRIKPRASKEEALAISRRLLQILQDHGPLSVSHTWNHAKDAGIVGLNSKTHMKLMLKWMTGRKVVKLSCTHVGSAKKFTYSTRSQNPQAPKEPSNSSPSSDPKVTGQRKRDEPKKQVEALR